jgi:hypothetical protein
MNKHNLHYLDLNPEARPPEEPSDLAIIADRSADHAIFADRSADLAVFADR